jgi:virulence-associated protein VapD
MKRVEKQTRETDSYGLVARIILSAIGLAGVIGVGMMAPGVFQTVKIFRGYERLVARRYQIPSYIRRTMKSLERRGMVRIVKKQGEVRVYLTDKGQQELLKYQLREKRLMGGRWDKKWRIVIFDIAEKRRSARDRIRIDMKVFGFEKLQDSVWVYPYECEEVISLLKTRYKAGKELVYIVASDIENDMRLRKTFQLE